MIGLPAGFHVARVDIGPADDRHACGRRAAHDALAALGIEPSRLGYDGTRPIVAGGGAAVSITHGRTIALAVAASHVTRIGIDVCDDDPRLLGLAPRFLAEEQALAGSVLDLAACFAAKEAALKALGLGLVDGGVLDGTAVSVLSLAPPKLSQPDLTLALGRVPGAAVAVVYGP
jgi:phosphopantetheinyl transferase (holo-ACP synthase)